MERREGHLGTKECGTEAGNSLCSGSRGGLAEARYVGKGWVERVGRWTQRSAKGQAMGPRGFACCAEESGPGRGNHRRPLSRSVVF